jgi:hypothetical protein
MIAQPEGGAYLHGNRDFQYQLGKNLNCGGISGSRTDFRLNSVSKNFDFEGCRYELRYALVLSKSKSFNMLGMTNGASTVLEE